MDIQIKSALLGAIIPTIGSFTIFILGNFSTQDILEKNIVETLSGYFDSVDKDMSYEQALQTIYKENENLKIEINNYTTQVNELSKEIENKQAEIDLQNSTDEVKEVIQAATDYWNDSDYIEALTLLKNEKSKSTDINNLYEQYSDEYILVLLSQAESLILENERDKAIDILKKGTVIVYDSSVLNDKINNITDKQPVKISDLQVFFEGMTNRSLMGFEDFNGDYKKDNLSHIHASGLVFNIYAEGNLFREYIINQEYNSLSGVFSITYPSRNDHTKAYICIYGDDELIYQSDIITGGIEPISITNIDISNVKKLKIELNSSNGSWTKYALYDCILQPK